MAVKAWTAKHTGLPCIYSDEPVRVVASDGRVLVDQAQGSVLVADALAAPGASSTYTVGGQQITITRRDAGHQVSGIDGRQAANVAWLGRDEDDWDTGLSEMRLAARSTPILRYSLRSPTPTGRARMRTIGAATRVVRELLKSRAPIVAIHSPSACQMQDCDVPAVRVMGVSGAGSEQTGRTDKAARAWSLDYTVVDPADSLAYSGAAPVVTWGEWAGLGTGWQNRTAVQVAQIVAGMPA